METKNILVDSGLNFEVESRPHFVQHFDKGEFTYTESETSNGVFRTDTGKELCSVSPTYEVIQNCEVLQPFVEAMNQGYLEFKHGFPVKDGRSFIVTFSTGKEIVHGENLERRIVVGGSHDGTTSVYIMTEVLRLICTNGLKGFAAKDKWAIRHTKNWRDRYSIVLKALEETDEFYNIAFRQYAGLFDKPCPYTTQLDLTHKLLGVENGEMSTRKQNQVESILTLATTGKGIAGNTDIQGTAAAWYNAVVEYYDHKASNKDEEKRQVSAMLGNGATQKRKAFQLANSLG